MCTTGIPNLLAAKGLILILIFNSFIGHLTKVKERISVFLSAQFSTIAVLQHTE